MPPRRHSCTDAAEQPGLATAPTAGPAGEGEQQVCEEDKDERGMLPITPCMATRMYADSSADRLRVTVTQAYIDGQDMQWRLVYEMSRTWTTSEKKILTGDAGEYCSVQRHNIKQSVLGGFQVQSSGGKSAEDRRVRHILHHPHQQRALSSSAHGEVEDEDRGSAGWLAQHQGALQAGGARP